VELITSPNIQAQVSNDGTLFWNGLKAQYQVPLGGNKNTLSAASLWIGGLDTSKKLHLAAQTYRETGSDFWPGPLNNVGETDSATSVKYNQIYKVTKLEIDSFILGLSVPKSILLWPGNGDTTKGYSKRLAPFVDKDSDGVYEPSQGDYPAIKGDIAFWWVYNDFRNHTESKSTPLGVEVSVLAYSFSCGENHILSNSLFFDYTIVNKSQKTYNNAFVGSWTDFDIGNPHNDYIGIDRNQSSIYGYNSLTNDRDTLGILGADTIRFNGYKGNLPVQSVSFGKGLQIGNTFYQPSSFMPVFNSEVGGNQGKPRVANHYYNYLKGLWLNGDSMTSAGTGWKTSAPTTTYAFDGNPINKTGWNELSSKNIISDRSSVTSFGNVVFAPNDTLRLTTIYTTHLSNSNKIEDGLQLRVKEVSQLNEWVAKGGLYPCTAVSTCTTSPSCVWPGDADNDGVTSARDIFRIGYAYGETGPKRSIVSIGNAGQTASDFSKNFPDGLNFKYADANGDGIIDTNDVISIASNFGTVHKKKETELNKKGTGTSLLLDIQGDSVEPGQIVTIYIKLGDGSLKATDVYGVAFSVLFDNQVIDSSSINIDINGWLTIGGKFVGIVKDEFVKGKSNVGISRGDKVGRTDSGVIVIYKYVISDNISGGFKPKIDFKLYDFIAVNSLLDTIPLFVTNDSIHLKTNSIEEFSYPKLNRVEVYPNPTQSNFFVQTDRYPISKVTIIDGMGRVVRQDSYNKQITLSISTESLEAGIYTLLVEDSKKGVSYAKISVMKP
jgi:hypothetical protein